VIERALQATFRHLTTVFLLVALVATPLHVAYAIAFKDVIAVDAVHDRIEDLPEGREIKGVDSGLLGESRAYFLLLEAIELMAAVILLGAVVRVLEDEDAARMPTVSGALKGIGRRPHLNFAARLWASIAICAVIAVGMGYLTEVSLVALSDVVSPDHRWAWIAVSRAAARSLSAPFVLVPIALASRAKGKATNAPNLY
jgi:hypothetical protein